MAGEPETLDVEEDLERRRHRHWFDRLIMLSDGVFSIAITLLAFDLHPPASWTSLTELWSNLGRQLDAYAMSFVVISVYWLAHRRFFAMILTVDAPVTVLNLVTLALVALVPAATEFVHGHGPQQMEMLIYSLLVIAIGTSLAALWGYAALIANLVDTQVTTTVRWFLLALMMTTPPLFLFLLASLGAMPFGVIPMLLTGLFLIGWRMRLWTLSRLLPPTRGLGSRPGSETLEPS